MKRIVLREHGRLVPLRDGEQPSAEAVGLPVPFYERLRRFDAARDEDTAIFTWYATHARARQWVGVIELDGLRVEVLPKVATLGEDRELRRMLGVMLAYAGDIPLRLRDVAGLSHRSADLAELIAAAFAERLLEELLLGPERSYIARRENLSRLRGKLAMARHVVVNAAHRERFLCDHDELVADTPLNQIFRAACEVLSASVRANATLDLLERCSVILDDVARVVVTPELFDRVVLNRQTQRFAPLLELCRLLFAGRTPTTERGDTRTFSLLFDMNAVFERFLAGFFAREVMPQLPGWRLHVQAKHHARYLFSSEGRGVLRLEPDLLLEGPGDRRIVLDAKWKLLEAGKERTSIARSDLYQLYAYSQRYQAERSVLLYPDAGGITGTKLHLLEGVDQKHERCVEVAGVSLPAGATAVQALRYQLHAIAADAPTRVSA